MNFSLPTNWAPPRWAPAIYDDEPPHGLYLRLCDINGVARADVMYALTGVNITRVRLGQDLAGLERISRCPLPDLQRQTYEGGSGAGIRVRGHAFRVRHDVLITSRRLCPQCLNENSYHRFWWDLSFVETCPRHGRRLVSHCACGEALSWKSGLLRGCHMCCNDELPASEEEPDAGILAVDAWAISRLCSSASRESPSLLAGLRIRNAIEIMERVGVIHIRGIDDRWSGFEGLGVDAAYARARGYEIVRDGRFENVLRRAGIINPEHWLATACESSFEEFDSSGRDTQLLAFLAKRRSR